MHPEASPDLVERAKRDRAAFGELYDIYVQRVYGFCLVHSKNREEAEDLTAQTFERALGAIGRYEQQGAPFSAWLFRIAARLAIDRARRSSRVTTTDDLPEPDPRERPDESPSAVVERWERAVWLLGHVEHLPLEQQQAVQLRFWEEHSFAEIGERLGRSEEAAKQLVYRALRGLRRGMDREARGYV
jgi:RNA polymerase sigma-70 factor (ECF subfamily)